MYISLPFLFLRLKWQHQSANLVVSSLLGDSKLDCSEEVAQMLTWSREATFVGGREDGAYLHLWREKLQN